MVFHHLETNTFSFVLAFINSLVALFQIVAASVAYFTPDYCFVVAGDGVKILQLPGPSHPHCAIATLACRLPP